jgi:hypothetical protein
MRRARAASASALGVLTLLGMFVSSSLRAQDAEWLGPRWVAERGAAGPDPFGVACSRTKVFVVEQSSLERAPSGTGYEGHTRVRVWDGQRVRELPLLEDDYQGNQAVASPAGHLYLPTGRSGPTRVAHFDGARWTILPVLDPSGRPYALGFPTIRVFDEAHIYITGEGSIARLEGDHFVAYSAGTRRELYGIDGRSPRDLWVAGDFGTVLHWDGTTFTTVPIDTDDTLSDVMVTANGDVWVSSNMGMFVRRRGVWSRGNPQPEAIRVNGNWTMPDGTPPQFFRFQSRAGFVSLDDDVVTVGGANGWTTEVRGWSLVGGCATATQLVIVGHGAEGATSGVSRPADLLHRPL